MKKEPIHLPAGMGRALMYGMLGAHYVVFVLLLLIYPRLIGRDWRRQLAVRRPPVAHLMLALAAVPAFIIVSNALAKLFFQAVGSAQDPAQEEMLKDLFAPFPWWVAVLAVGLGPGLIEELWCRGFLGRGLLGKFGWVDGVALTSMLFGMLHVFPPAYVLVTAVMGLMLHYTYVVSRSLWVPVLIHTLNNSIAVLGATGHLALDGIERNILARPAVVVGLGVLLLLSVAAAMWTARARVVATHATEGTRPSPFATVALPRPGEGRVVDPLPAVLPVLGVIAFLVGLAYVLSRPVAG